VTLLGQSFGVFIAVPLSATSRLAANQSYNTQEVLRFRV